MSLNSLYEHAEEIREHAKERNRRYAERAAADAAARAVALEAERLAFTGECFPCRDRGVIDDDPCPACAAGHAEATRQERERFAALWSAAEIPPRFRDYSLATYPLPESRALARIREFVESWDGRRGLILTGPYGVGKTGLMVGALRAVSGRLTDPGEAMRFTTGADLMDWLRAGYDDDTYPARVARAKTVGLLAIDDLGAERPTDYVLEQFFTIINHRYERCAPTWATTNLGPDDLAKRIGPRVWERLLDGSLNLAVKGRNLRGEPRA